MTEKDEKKVRCRMYKGIGFFLVIMAICALTGIVSAANTYVAADQNANGEYQIVYTVNSDGSQLFNAAGVAHGTMDTDPPPAAGPGPDQQSVCQDVDMNGQYGYALVAASDASGNQADSETWLNNGQADVHQGAGIISPHTEATAQNAYTGPSVGFPFTGAYSYQCVYSPEASSIIADTDAQTLDDTTAAVEAQATGIHQTDDLFNPSSGPNDGNRCEPVFCVHQFAVALSPVTLPTEAYSSDGLGISSLAIAGQCGKIKGADTASVETSASTPNGLSTMVSASVNGGGNLPDSPAFSGVDQVDTSYLKFGMFSLAGNGLDGCSLLLSDADIKARGESGTTSASSNGPNGQFATVDANFVHNGTYEKYGKIDIDLSAFAKLNDDVKTKVENKLSGCLKGYDGTVTALNSGGPGSSSDSSTFSGNKHAGGVSGVVTETDTGFVEANWAHTWPHI